MVGIRDIANKAGVAISTVSYALNGSPRVSEVTREKIIKIAEEMNYVPNMAGQNLKKQQTNIVSVYLSSYQGTFYSELLEGMNKKANSVGLELIVCTGKRSRLFLPQRMVDGILVLDETYSDKELLQYAEMDFPIVVLDRQIDHENIRSVLLDNKNGTLLAMKSLLNKKIQHLYIVTGSAHNHDSIERTETAIKVAQDNKIKYTLIQGNFTEKSGYDAGKKISDYKKQVIGIFALNDEMAIGIHNYILKNHGDILNPNIFIYGFDKNKITQYLNPPIRSVGYAKEEWGAQAIDSLYKMIENMPVKNKTIKTYFK